MEEQNNVAGFALILPYLEESSHVTISEPPWPDFGQFDIPIDYNDQVKRAIHILRTGASGVFDVWLRRTNQYRPMIESILSSSGLPGDLVYVAMIESGFDPRARSTKNAAGLWQLSRPDAVRFGLARNSEIDERYDPEKSTRAAAARFKKLYLELGSWDLVLAAHHAGMTSLRNTQGLGLWNMELPRNTIPFVAFVMASAIIAKSPEVYGFEPLGGLPLIHEAVPVEKTLVLDEVAKGMKIQVKQLHQLNPELREILLPKIIYDAQIASESGTSSPYRYMACRIDPTDIENLELFSLRICQPTERLRIVSGGEIHLHALVENMAYQWLICKIGTG